MRPIDFQSKLVLHIMMTFFLISLWNDSATTDGAIACFFLFGLSSLLGWASEFLQDQQEKAHNRMGDFLESVYKWIAIPWAGIMFGELIWGFSTALGTFWHGVVS